METYRGKINSTVDCLLLFEACRQGVLNFVPRRLSEREREQIASGSIFVWEEQSSNIRRWTDSRNWSASRVVGGSFLQYKEMIRAEDAVGYPSSSQEDVNEYGSTSDGYRYKPEGLIKQSFSITTSTNIKLHLISYFARQDLDRLVAPTEDPRLKHVKIPEGLYPESVSSQDSRVSSVSPHPMGPPRSDSYPVASSYGPPSGAPYYNPGPSPPQQHHQQLQHHQQHQRRPVYGPGPVHHHAPPPQQPAPPHRPGSYQLPPPHRSQPIPRPTQIQAQHYPTQLYARDIPYDRVAFGEDQRAIQVLDKRFAL